MKKRKERKKTVLNKDINIENIKQSIANLQNDLRAEISMKSKFEYEEIKMA